MLTLYYTILKKKKPTVRLSLDPSRSLSQGGTIFNRIFTYCQNHPRLLSILGFVVIGSLLYVGRRQQLQVQRELEARKEIWPAEAYLREGSYDLALEGGSGDLGLLEVIVRFKDTKIENLAHCYAAVAYLKRSKSKEDEEEAIKHLKQVDCEGTFLHAHILCLLGDLYANRKAYEEALAYYEKAVAHRPNPFTTPKYLFRIAALYEEMKAYKKAAACYKEVYNTFPDAVLVEEARKNEGRLEHLASKQVEVEKVVI